MMSAWRRWLGGARKAGAPPPFKEASVPLPFEMLSVATARAAIAGVVEPLVCDMEAVRAGKWARPLSGDHRALLEIRAFKGGVLELVYGISCSWVPHLEGNRWRWHRTLKQSRLDLWVDHFTVDAPPCRYISHLHGLDYLLRQAGEAVEAVAPQARHWWDSVTAVPGVLTEALRQEGDGVTPSVHWPHPGVVAAFTLCRLGDVDGAEQHLRTAGRLGETQLAGALERLAELARMTS